MEVDDGPFVARQWKKRLETRSRRGETARSTPDPSTPSLYRSLHPHFLSGCSMNLRVYIRRLKKTVRSNQHNDGHSFRILRIRILPDRFVEVSELTRERVSLATKSSPFLLRSRKPPVSIACRLNPPCLGYLIPLVCNLLCL